MADKDGEYNCKTTCLGREQRANNLRAQQSDKLCSNRGPDLTWLPGAFRLPWIESHTLERPCFVLLIYPQKESSSPVPGT